MTRRYEEREESLLGLVLIGMVTAEDARRVIWALRHPRLAALRRMAAGMRRAMARALYPEGFDE